MTALGAFWLAAGVVAALLAIAFPAWYARVPTARKSGDLYVYLGRAPVTNPPEKNDRRIADFARPMALGALWPDPRRATVVLDWQGLASELAAILVICGGAVSATNVFLRERTADRRASQGLCPACGYDWRATTDRCPECGRRPDGGTPPPSSP
jgi:hypothetical protein